jgi:hypothetical protein
MPQNQNLPKPPVAQPGKMPQPGQWAPYQDDDGVLWPAFITGVKEKSPDGKYFNVDAVKLVDGDPVTGEWIFDVKSAYVLYNPPGPPWP